VVPDAEGYLHLRTLTEDSPVILCGLGVAGWRVGTRGTTAGWGSYSSCLSYSPAGCGWSNIVGPLPRPAPRSLGVRRFSLLRLRRPPGLRLRPLGRLLGKGFAAAAQRLSQLREVEPPIPPERIRGVVTSAALARSPVEGMAG
jgi:hypothetical protein